MTQNKDGCNGWGIFFTRFTWTTMERNFFSNQISAKEERIEL